MKTEELLKNISSLLKKHEIFLNSNPEIFYAIEDRLLKAVDDNNDEQDYDSSSYDETPEDDEIPADDEEPTDEEPTDDEATSTEEPTDDDEAYLKEQQDEPKASGANEWKPNKYSPDQQKKISAAIDQGFSHREAERMANAHSAPSDIHTAGKWATKASNPSTAMHQLLRDDAMKHMTEHEKDRLANADQASNPVVHSAGKIAANREAVHGDFKKAFKDFLKSPEYENATPEEANKMEQQFEENYHKQNTGYKEAATNAADFASQIHGDSSDAAQGKYQEEKEAIMGGGGAGDGVVGEYSQAAAGADEGPISSQAASQSLGAEGDEDSAFTSGTTQDPYSAYGQANPKLAEKYKQEKAAKETQEGQQLVAATPKEEQAKALSSISPEKLQSMRPSMKAAIDAHIAKLSDANGTKQRVAAIKEPAIPKIKG